ACAAAGLSREAAYRLRKRDPLFAEGWAAALESARVKPSDPPPCCPINGIVEVVTYRGRPVGTRRRYSTRLLLAHLGRLDRLVEKRTAGGYDFNARTV
ncbi:MAG TPA: hypothetical protein VLA37_11605, partial [Sphingomonadaceae bacterium]|nr:hypothetical protein [Sphingomonadaceae bacterium]